MLTFIKRDDAVSSADGSYLRLNLARRVYEQGGHAAIQAELTVPPLAKMMKAGEFVFQRRPNDWTRSAALRADAQKGSTSLIVEYTSMQRPCVGGGTNKDFILGAYDVKLDVS